MKKLVVYTAIFGGYDELRTPLITIDQCDFICFTDDPDLTSDFWTIRLLTDESLSSAYLSRRPKILPHEYFPDYEASLYVDANLLIVGDLHEYIEKYCRTSPMLCIKHGERDCVYEELQACLEGQRDDATTMSNQIERYQWEGLPAQFGLIVGSFLYRKHHHPDVIAVMNLWWSEFSNNSKRDQLSFTYSCWKNRFHYDLCYANNWNNDYFVWFPHRTPVNQFYPDCYQLREKAPAGKTLATFSPERTLSERALMPAKFYVDYGEGFSEANIFFVAPEMDHGFSVYSFKTPEGTKQIRFDPIEGSKCIVTTIVPTADGEPLSIRSTNSRNVGGLTYFDTTDPMYLIETIEPGAEIRIRLKIIVSAKIR